MWVEIAFAVGLALLSIIVLMALIDMADVPHKSEAAAAPPKPIPESESTGRLMQVDADGCVVTEFDNANGRFTSQQSISCPQPADADKQRLETTTRRLHSINKGFQK